VSLFSGCGQSIETSEGEPFGRVRSAVWFELTVDSQLDDAYDHSEHLFYASNRPGLCEALGEAAAVMERYSDEWFGGVDESPVEDQCDWWGGYLGEMHGALGDQMGADSRLFSAAYFEPICIHAGWPPEGSYGPACGGDGVAGFFGSLLYLDGDYFPDLANNLITVFGLPSDGACVPGDVDELTTVEHYSWSGDPDDSWQVEKVDTDTIRLTFDIQTRDPFANEATRVEGTIAFDRCQVSISPESRLLTNFEPFLLM